MASRGLIDIGMNINTSKFEKSISTARTKLNKFGKSLFTVKNAFVGFIGAVGAGVVVHKVIGKVADELERIDRLSKLADRLGATTEELTGLAGAAQLAGVDVENFGDILSDMLERIGDAQIGLAGEAFGDQGVIKQLGLDIDKLESQNPVQTFKDIAEAISQLDTQAQKINLADRMFGGEAQKIVPFLDQGEEGINKLIEAAKKAGLAFDDIDAKKIKEANAAIRQAQASLEGVYRTIAIEIAPVITELANRFSAWFQDTTSGGNKVSDVMDQVNGRVAWFLDILETGEMLAKGLFGGLQISLGILMKGLATTAELIQGIINLIPGVEVTFADTVNAMADATIESGDKILTNLEKQFTDSSYGDKYKQFLKEITAESNTSVDTGVASSFESTTNKLREIQAETDKLKAQADAVRESLMTPMDKLEKQLADLEFLRDKGHLTEEEYYKAVQKTNKEIEDLRLGDLKSEAERIAEEIKTPFEAIREEVALVNKLFDEGLITEEQKQKKLDLLAKDAEGLVKKEAASPTKFAAAAEKGTNAARQIILGHNYRNEPLDKLSKVNEEQLQQQKEQTDLLRTIALAKNSGSNNYALN